MFSTKARRQEEPMLKKLRLKFIAAIMTILAIVLTLIFASVCIIKYQSDSADVQKALETAMIGAQEHREPMLDPDAQDGDEVQGRMSIGRPPMPDRHDMSDTNIPVAVFQEKDGVLEYVPQSSGWLETSVQAVIEDKLSDIHEGIGSLDEVGLIYSKQQMGTDTYVAFTNLASVDGWMQLALIFLFVELFALIVFLGISILFSRWALAPVEHAWASQRKFVSDASHELKTPLSIIKANTAIMLEEPDMPTAERRSWLLKSQAAEENMHVLVDEMLELASLDEQRASSERVIGTAEFEEVDLSRLLEQIVLQFDSLSFERGFDLAEEIPPGAIIRTDRSAVRKVVETLLDNACKYVDHQGTVSLSLVDSSTSWKVEVSNTGSFIPEDKRESIFDRFYRADDARTTGSGHGLGLAIAKSTAESIGGALHVESDEVVTTFIFQIPKG